MKNRNELFDELNVLRIHLEAMAVEFLPNGNGRLDGDEVEDMLLDYLIYAYTFGVDEANEQLNTDTPVNRDELRTTLYKKIDDKDFAERVREYAAAGEVENIMRVAATEAHRDANAGAYNTAKKSGAKSKVWNTMKDPKVRDTHDYLDGMEVDLDDEFYTYNGDHTLYPGQFGVPGEDANCRCFVTYKK